MLNSKKIIGKARVLFPFKAGNRDELNLKIEDVINVLQKDLPDKGWWLGEVNGVVGVFPDNFVRILPEMPEQNKSHRHTNGVQGEGSNYSLFDCMKASSKKLNHITATRVKGPQRRPPSHILAKVEGEYSSSSSVVSVVLNEKSNHYEETGGSNSSRTSSKPKNKEHLDSCWGNGQESPDSTFSSPRFLSSESPVEIIQLNPPNYSGKNIKHSNLASTSNSSIESYRRSNMDRNERSEKVSVLSRRGEFEKVAGGDRLEDDRMERSRGDGKERKGEVVTVESYTGMLKEVQALKSDIREQAQTNDRMVQTLKNFLSEEKHKVRLLTMDFERIKQAVHQDITFL